MPSFEEKLLENFERLMKDAMKILKYDDSEAFSQLKNVLSSAMEVATNITRRDQELYEEIRQKCLEIAELVKEKNANIEPFDFKVMNCYIAIGSLTAEFKKLYGRGVVVAALLKWLEDYRTHQMARLGLTEEDLEDDFR